MEADRATIIDAHADVEGTFKGKDAQVFGRFKGELQLSGRLLIGEGSRVEAKVAADVAEIAGEFKGDVTARSVTIAEKGRVEGSVNAQVLVVREGAQLNGSVSAGGAGKGKGTAASAAGVVAG